MTFLFALMLLAGFGVFVVRFRNGSAPAGLVALGLVLLLAGLAMRSVLRSRDAPFEDEALAAHLALGRGAGELARVLRVGPGPVVVLDPPSDIPLVEDARRARRRGLARELRRISVVEADLFGGDFPVLASAEADPMDPRLLDHVLRRHEGASAVVSYQRLKRIGIKYACRPGGLRP